MPWNRRCFTPKTPEHCLLSKRVLKSLPYLHPGWCYPGATWPWGRGFCSRIWCAASLPGGQCAVPHSASLPGGQCDVPHSGSWNHSKPKLYIVPKQYIPNRGIFVQLFLYFIQYCFICRPSYSTVPGDARDRTQDCCVVGNDRQTGLSAGVLLSHNF